MALSPVRGIRQGGYSALPRGTTAGLGFKPGTPVIPGIQVCGLIHLATTAVYITTLYTHHMSINMEIVMNFQYTVLYLSSSL